MNNELYMKTLRYLVFILLALLSIDVNARNSAFANRNYPLDINLGEIFEPMKLHEYYDTKKAANDFGNENNEVCFFFTVYRPTLILANFNGSDLVGINARLLYMPLDENEDYVDVTDPISEENYEEELPQRFDKLYGYLNVSLDENIVHGCLGDLIFQMIQPGHYILFVEGDDVYGNDYNGIIRNNIYINPIGISSEQPVEVGYFSEDFYYQFSGTFVEYDSNEVCYFINLRYPMKLHVSSQGSANVSSIELVNKTGQLIAVSDDFPLENDSYPQIGEIVVAPGDYFVHIYFKDYSNMNLDIAGKFDLPVGDRKQDPLLIPVVSDVIDYIKAFDTSEYSDFYYASSVNHGKSTKDVFHRLVLENSLDILISAPFCSLKSGASILLLNGEDEVLAILDTSLKEEMLVENLKPGIYYIVSEGNKEDGEITLCVKGDKHYDRFISNNKNYVTTLTPNIAISTSGLMNNPLKVRQSVSYYDYLGRLKQDIQYAASPTLQDYITYAEYDELGRESAKWLPVVSANAATYMSLEDVKRISLDLYQDACAYERTIYEMSSLNRILENYGAGEVWQNAEKGIKNIYRTNVFQDYCKYFKVTGKRTLPVLQMYNEAYPISELEIVETKDEDNHLNYQFTDKRENVILERQIAENDTLDTYYVYDDFNNLCFVLPPVATDSLAKNNMQEILDRYAYQYRYDSRNRCIGKKFPGCDWIENVYDFADRLLFSQDGEQRKKQEWSFQFSDLFGRQLLRGIYHGVLDPVAFESANVYVVFAPDSATAKYGYVFCNLKEIVLDNLEVLQAKYFDTYEYGNHLSGFVSALNYEADENYGKRYGNDQVREHCKGLLTGCMTRVLETNQELYSSYYYDYNRNLIQSRQTTITGNVVVAKSIFNFNGQPMASCEEYDNGVRLEKSYVYDHQGRLTEETHIIGTQLPVCFKYGYDELGRMESLTRINGTDSLTTTNSYNIRDWLTSIESPIFKQALHYTDGLGTPCYSGNISSMIWQTDASTIRGYQFSYDGFSRLKNAVYGEGNSLSNNEGHFNEQVTGYDKMGNIVGLKRFGQISENDYGLIDDLSFFYNGNQLRSVDDESTNSAYAGGFEFKDGIQKTIEYTYDSNGNLIQDLNKKIADIQYNCLNLPNQVQFEDGNSISYVYDANGTKLRTTHIIDGNTTTTDYYANVIYENEVPKLLLTECGYITLPDTVYHYFLQDHQGNTRVVVEQDGNVEEENHYYPFGGVCAQKGNVQPYKYNGKELDRKGGLDWYDYGARHYDATLGRFMKMDRYAEKYVALSPYQYAANNPVNIIDINGDSLSIQANPNGLFDQIKLYFGFDTKFQKLVKADISRLKTDNKEVGDMIEKLEKSTNMHTITMPRKDKNENSSTFDENKAVEGVSQGSVIGYDPYNWTDINGKRRNPRTALSHELRHSYDADVGSVTFEKTENGIGIMEVRAINTENKIRIKTGDPRRISYGGKKIPEKYLE